MGYHSGPVVVTDSLVFCFDAGNLRCTHTDRFGQYQGSVDVTSMFNVAPVVHSSQTALSGQSNPEIKGVVGAGNTGNFSFPTDTGAATAIDLSISAKNSAGDSDDYNNRLELYVDSSDNNPTGKITFADQAAQSYEFWGKIRSGAQATFHSLAGRGATSGPWISQYRTSDTSWLLKYRDNDGQYRDSSVQSSNCVTQYHQMVFSIGTDRDIHFYVDGALVNTVTSSDTAASINRIMAGYSSSTSRYGYQGTFLCCRIYSKELSADEVKQNFEATRWRVGI